MLNVCCPREGGGHAGCGIVLQHKWILAFAGKAIPFLSCTKMVKNKRVKGN